MRTRERLRKAASLHLAATLGATKPKKNRKDAKLDENANDGYSLVAVEVNAKRQLKFIVDDGIDQFKMYVESIQRDHLVTKCTHHYRAKCMARHSIKTRLEVVKAGYKHKFADSVKKHDLANLANYTLLPHKVT